MIEAQVILDSISPDGHRLTTMKLRYPRFIHSEFMTHRVFSRNASSSRAVPTVKRIEETQNPLLRATPVSWGKNQRGMQAKQELDPKTRARAMGLWERAAADAAATARLMLINGVHKQIVNRILEPFTHIDVVMTATEYMNFFGLRLDPGAQPEIQELARQMFLVYNESDPKLLEPGHWHLPFLTADDLYHMDDELRLDQAIKVSVARCARTSYLSFETGKTSTVDEDLQLYDKLMVQQPVHASPAEHQATPDEFEKGGGFDDFGLVIPHFKNPDEHGNFTGWRQYRKMIPGEACAPLPTT